MLKNLLDADEEPEPTPGPAASKPHKTEVIGLFGPESDLDETVDHEPFVLSNAAPESIAETARRSGLAWSMGIAFFSAVVFMLLIGWGADLLFGSSPWGKVAGIVLGSVIGFVQLFRISSQIFRK
ncbi:MAG: AtpZ/AtpI family protein [Pyrinomonadaceae bacterium]